MPKKLLLFLAATLIYSCKKPSPEPDLPPLSHKGINMFACYKDGDPYIASVDFKFAGPVAVSGSFNEETKLLRIQGTREGEENRLENLAFMVFVSNSVGIYDMSFETSEFKGYIDSKGITCVYYHDTLSRGLVQITHLDENQNIIAGLFSMTLVNPDCLGSKSMKLTEGRFDFGY